MKPMFGLACASAALALGSCVATVDEAVPAPVVRVERVGDKTIAAQLARPASVDFTQRDLRELLFGTEDLFPAHFWCPKVLIDRIPDVKVNLKAHHSTVGKVLDALLAQAGLQRAVRAGRLFIGTPAQIADVVRAWSYLQETGPPVLEQRLARRVHMCSPSPIPYADFVEFLATLSRIKIDTRFDGGEDPLHRFECFNFDDGEGLELRDLLRFIALDCSLKVAIEGDRVVFTKVE